MRTLSILLLLLNTLFAANSFDSSEDEFPYPKDTKEFAHRLYVFIENEKINYVSIGITKSSILRWIKGEMKPKKRTTNRIFAYLKNYGFEEPQGWLLTGELRKSEVEDPNYEICIYESKYSPLEPLPYYRLDDNGNLVEPAW